MPGLTGPQVLARFRPARPGFPVVVMSGDADAATVAAIEADPHAAFLAKPFGAAALLGAVAELVGAAAYTS
jgi:DNA-binding NtrC family response regulator